ncbi:sulfite exporter TauE/SafE family protein [Curtanaerobium respiraculi]|uniref:sulfite exporter TauE/SafE family protein n=1 Tax=Curtanaerobium respiraculi TaxID=2949669 RepID=UPI0024B36DA2|nr:sulfite exporter TauE/SafE family protein [Curtanaerobium respiraculi]
MIVTGTLIAATLSGIAIGILSGLLGIGGGVVMVPLFRLGFGLTAIEATATSLFAIIPTGISGAAAHIRNRTSQPAVGVAAGLGGALTSPAGVALATMSPGWAIMLAAALVIGYSAYNMLKKALKMPREARPARPEQEKAAPAIAPTGHATRKQLVVGFSIGLLAGVISGYVGVGGGFIMIPLFIAYAGISMKQASGTSLIAVAILALPGAVSQLMYGNVHLAIGLAVAVGSIPGAMLGANLAKRVPERSLRLLFGAMLLAAAAIMAANEFFLP